MSPTRDDAPGLTDEQISALGGIAPPKPERMLRWFGFEHLPPDLRETSGAFHVLAVQLVETLPAGAERTVALRKLLESKDAAVRARIEGRP